MRIIAVSDLHGQVSWLLDTIERYGPDLLLSAGDWGDPGLLSAEDFAPILDRVRVLSIYGNHDDRELMGRLRNRDGSHVLIPQGGTRRAGRVVIGGISGIWAKTRLGSRLNARWEAARRRNPSLALEQWLAGRELPPYVTDEDVAAFAEHLALRRVDVLVTHACASGLADRTPTGGRGGQRCFREASDAIRPRIHVCGHLHRLQRQNLAGGRAALNCGHGAEGFGWIIDWNAGRWRARSLEGGRLASRSRHGARHEEAAEERESGGTGEGEKGGTGERASAGHARARESRPEPGRST